MNLMFTNVNTPYREPGDGGGGGTPLNIPGSGGGGGTPPDMPGKGGGGGISVRNNFDVIVISPVIFANLNR